MHLLKSRKLILIFLDSLLFSVVFWGAAIAANYSTSSVQRELSENVITFLILYVSIFGARFAASTYNNVWRFANSRAYLVMVIADLVGGAIGTGICYLTNYIYIGIWQSVAVTMTFSLMSLSMRFCYQQQYRHLNLSLDTLHKTGVAIVGAGNTGSMLAEELMYGPKSRYKPICFIDNSPAKIGSRVCGLPVLAADEKVIGKLKAMPVQEIVIALPELDSASVQNLITFYGESGCAIKLYDFPFKESAAPDKNAKRTLREVRIEDLLFRDSLKVVGEEAGGFYRDRTVLITGGGGSIGGELCRQVAKLAPRKLVLFDIYENNAYDIEQELRREYGTSLDLVVEIGSVRDVARLENVFAYYRPEIVFHAAAHKHVPLMEHSGTEAIKNNCLGTYNTANAAEKYGCEKFILISTDKAVNPTNVMGATKRLCEMIVQCRTESKTAFAAVRFGNVLGSNGSVIPLFRRQIESGGPVTLTDKRIIRYFMTIPEASQLVMQAGAMAKRGELFVLDMGKPVKILDLAENMIRLSGLEPYKDIDIIEVGLRPGEKLYEELLIKTESLSKTENELIFVEHDTPYTREQMDVTVGRLRELCREDSEIGSERVKALLHEIVPTYRDPETVNRAAYKAPEMQIVK